MQLLRPLCLIIAMLWLIAPAYAQNNLNVDYSSSTTVPDFLNVCGNSDQVIVTVSTDGFGAIVRSNIEASVQLFEGVSLTDFDAANSSPGISLSNNSNPNNPVFSIPDLSPSSLSSIDIVFSIAADCAYVDTLSNNNQIQVFDTWTFNYDFGNLQNVIETDFTSEYRDAFAVPFFTVDIENNNAINRVNECATRTVMVSNSSFNGFVDNLTYTNTQGEGVYVQNVFVNGQSIEIIKTPLLNGDTIISANITGDYFQQNQNGNSNNIFEANESLIITEEFCISACLQGTISVHALSWGCGDEICSEVFDIDFVSVGEGGAFVEFEGTGSLPNQNTGYCQEGQNSITFSNNGYEFDEGFGAMLDLQAGIGLGNDFALADNGYQITAVQIAGINVLNNEAFININNHPSFSDDPDGAGGLADVDGDGFYDDLPLGQSLEVGISYYFTCTDASAISPFGEGCTNDFTSVLHAKVDWTNSCSERETFQKSAFYRPVNNNTAIQNLTDTDAFAEEDIFFVTHTETRAIRDFDLSCNGQEQLIVKVALPPGINPEVASTVFLKNEFNQIPLLSSNISNDTLTLTYDASFSPFLNGDYSISLGFSADCSAALGALSFPMTLEFYCPGCDCKHLWYCGTLDGPQLHNQNPPCPPETTLDCPTGIQTTDFQVNRTTFGYTDPTYTTPINPEDANSKVAISCDLVEMKVDNIVGQTPVNDNVGIVITYKNTDETVSTNDIFSYQSGVVRFMKNNVEYNCNIPISQLDVEVSGDEKKLTFDLSTCLSSLNLTLTEGDSINFIGQFSVNPEGPYTTQFRVVPNLRAYGFTIVSGQEEACDNFGENFTIAKTRTAFDFPNNDDYPIGCATSRLQYRLITVNNGFSEFFGNEYREATKIDSITFDFDTSIFDAFEVGNVEFSIPGHPIHGDSFFPIAPLSDFPDGHYVAHFDTLTQVPSLNVIQNYTFNLRIELTANCSAETGSINENNIYNLAPSIYFKDRYYARNISDGTCVENVFESIDNNIQYTLPPTLSLVPNSAANHVLTSDTATWTVQLCNTSPDSDALVAWIAAEENSGVLEFVSMIDVTIPATPLPLNTQNYGINNNLQFATTNPLLRSNSLNDFNDICNLIQIKALVNQCSNTTFGIKAGWNCSALPADWTPEDIGVCVEENLDLSVTVRTPFLEANIVGQSTISPEICETESITILLRNNDLGSTFDVKSQFILPNLGATIVAGSVEIAYPSNTPFIPALSEPVLMSSSLAGSVYQYDDFENLNTQLHENGLAGFNPITLSNNNEMLIRFSLATDCDFRSGELIRYNFQGMNGCNEPTNFEAGESLPINIIGAEQTTNQLYDISFSEESLILPGGESTLQVNITNLTTTPSTSTDLISITLPVGVSYLQNTTEALTPNNWNLLGPEIEIGGNSQILRWIMPAGLTEGEMASFNFNISSPEYDCEVSSEDVSLLTVYQTEIFCSSLNEVCTVETITSTTGANLVSLPVNGNLSVIYQNIVTQCVTGTQEELLVGGIVITSSASFEDQEYELDIYLDQNENGIIDENEILVHQVTINGAITMENALPFTFSFTTDTENVCSLISVLNLNGQPFCGDTQEALPTPVLNNAGEDFTFCATENTPFTTQLGSNLCVANESYSYEWIAIPPASLSDLSASNIPNPFLSFFHSGQVEPNLQYVLSTQRANCNIVYDTVTIIRAAGVIIDTPTDIQIIPNSSTSLSVDVALGTPPYSYIWSPASSLNSPTISTPTASPEESTEYSVTITDANGCEGSSTLSVIVINPIDVLINVTDTTICANESLQLEVSGGDTYLWEADPNNNGGQLNATNISNPVFSNGIGEETYIYSVIVSDSAFPEFMDTAVVSISINIPPTVEAGNAITICQGEQANLNANVEGIGEVILSWSPSVDFGQNATDAIVSPSISTTYTLTATDENGCTVTDQVLITVENCDCTPANVSGISTQNTACGETEGFAQINIVGNPNNYTYTWTPNVGNSNTTGNIKTNLPFGGYSVLIQNTNNPSCNVETFVLIHSENAPTATVITTNATCAEANGTATLSPADFTYEWGDFEGNTRSDLQTGTYFPTVTDPNNPNCQNVIAVQIGEDNPLSGSFVTLTEPDCGQANGTVQVNIDGGSGNYTYSWISDTNIQENLAAGIYSMTVTDSNLGCSLPLVFSLDNDTPNANITLDEIQNVSCPGSIDGGITYSSSPDNGFSNPADTIFSNGIQNFENGNLPVGNYCMQFVDENGCNNGSVCFEIEDPEPLNIQLVSTSACMAGGTIDITVSGGTGSYSYLWNDFTTLEDRTDLVAGVYSPTVTDENGCQISTSISVTTCDCVEPVLESINVNPSLCNEASGIASVFVEGIENNFNYTWIPNLGVSNATGNSKTNLPAGNYQVEISLNGSPTCITTANIMVTNADGPQVSIETTPATCQESNGTATLTPSNYIYDWQDPLLDVPFQDALPEGTYIVNVLDPDNPDCPNIIQVTIQEANPLTAEVTIDQQSICEMANGVATINVEGGSGNYGYSWPSNTATQTGLEAGIYSVTVTDLNSNNCQLPVLFVLTDLVPQANVSVNSIKNVSCPGGNDGALFYDIQTDAGFTPPLDSIFSNGINEFTNGNLPIGSYCIVLNDGNDCVAGGFCFDIEEPEPLIVQATSTPSCGNDGTINLTISGGTSPYDITWEDNPMETNTNLTGLAPGIFETQISDANGCIISSLITVDTCITCEVFLMADSIISQAINCNTNQQICINLDENNLNLYDFTDNNIPFNDFTFCTLDTVYYYNYTVLSGQGASGPYNISDWTIGEPLNQTFSGEFNDIATLVDSLNTWDPDGNWQSDETFVFGGNPLNTYQDMMINQVGSPIQTPLVAVLQTTPIGLAVNLSLGEHQLIATNNITGCMDTLFANIVCTQNETIDIEIELFQDSTICFDLNELTGEMATLYNDCEEETYINYEYQILADSCININAIAVGTENGCIVICDDLGICDTTFLNINVVDNNPASMYDTIIITELNTICFDTLNTSLAGEFATIQNICEDNAGELVNFSIDSETYCVEYEGLGLGNESACIQVCDEFNNCDTLDIFVTVVPGEYYFDTLYVSAPQDTFCLDTTILAGNIVSMTDVCPESNGENVDFTLLPDSWCVIYDPIGGGIDTACIRLEDEFGNITLTNMVITIIETTPHYYSDTIFIAESDTLCLDTSELIAPFLYAGDDCTDINNGFVDFFYNPVTNCIEYTGLELGKDTACVFVCDSLGVCDTTYFCITVEPYFNPPIAVPDVDTTFRGTPVVIDIKANDNIFGGIISTVIEIEPQYGTAIINPDCSITYLPDPEYCEREDVFSYQIQNENGSSITTVSIFIECEDLRVFNVISPNGDDINDVFYIAQGTISNDDGLQLEVYNRWGNLIYKSADYQNEWPGSFNNELDLPDGTYYYLLNWSNNGEKFFQRGFLDLRR